MCGIHAADGTPLGHHHHDHHHRHGPIFRPAPRPIGRRAFLGEFSKGTLALAVVTPLAAACGSSDGVDASLAASPDPTVVPDPTAAPEADASASGADVDEEVEAATDELRWARANLGFVSAYVLARGNTAAIVDTGVSGSAPAIGQSLATLGLNYSDVEHVILTHNHQDHAGSIGAVIADAVNATVYAGEADVSGIDQADIVGLAGGEDVFGFEMVATPGHTAGHMCVIDHAAGILVAGDALFSADGGVAEAPAQFTSDIEQSRVSIAALAALTYNTLLPGHGEPIESRADTAVAALADSF